jgi:chemotaxis protein methyltransferase CheR
MRSVAPPEYFRALRERTMSPVDGCAAEELELGALADAVERRSGIVIPRHRWPLLGAQIARLGGAETTQQLRSDNEAAWAKLLAALSVPETYFFRHRAHFELLERVARERLAAGLPCRVLCAGCSSGEEAWSAAAVLAAVGSPDGRPHRVIGWEMSETRLDHARTGRYATWAARRGLFGHDRFFTMGTDDFQVGPELRAMVGFRAVNLIDRSLPRESPFHVVLFRNVAIYWRRETVENFCVRLNELVDRDGFVCIGPSDPVSLPTASWERGSGDRITCYRRRPTGEATGSRSAHRNQTATRATANHASSARAAPATRPRPSLVAEIQSEAPPSNGTAETLATVQAWADQGRFSAALDLLRSDASAGSPEGKLWQGILLLNLDREQEAVGFFRQSVVLKPEEADYRRWLAVAYQAANRTADARREFRNAEQLECP